MSVSRQSSRETCRHVEKPASGVNRAKPWLPSLPFTFKYYMLGISGDAKEQQSCVALGHWPLSSVESSHSRSCMAPGLHLVSAEAIQRQPYLVLRTYLLPPGTYDEMPGPVRLGTQRASEATLRANRLRQAPKTHPVKFPPSEDPSRSVGHTESRHGRYQPQFEMGSLATNFEYYLSAIQPLQSLATNHKTATTCSLSLPGPRYRLQVHVAA